MRVRQFSYISKNSMLFNFSSLAILKELPIEVMYSRDNAGDKKRMLVKQCNEMVNAT